MVYFQANPQPTVQVPQVTEDVLNCARFQEGAEGTQKS